MGNAQHHLCGVIRGLCRGFIRFQRPNLKGRQPLGWIRQGNHAIQLIRQNTIAKIQKRRQGLSGLLYGRNGGLCRRNIRRGHHIQSRQLEAADRAGHQQKLLQNPHLIVQQALDRLFVVVTGLTGRDRQGKDHLVQGPRQRR